MNNMISFNKSTSLPQHTVKKTRKHTIQKLTKPFFLFKFIQSWMMLSLHLSCQTGYTKLGSHQLLQFMRTQTESWISNRFQPSYQLPYSH